MCFSAALPLSTAITLGWVIRDLRRVLRPGGRLWIYDARFALKRALRAAETNFDEVRREPAPTTRWPFPLFARLSARARP